MSLYVYGSEAALVSFLDTVVEMPRVKVCPIYDQSDSATLVESYFAVSLSHNPRFVTDACLDGDFDGHVSAAVAFLQNCRSDLVRLRVYPGVRIVFGYYHHSHPTQRVIRRFLPPALLSAAGELKIGIEFGYFTSPNPSQSDSRSTHETPS